MVHRIPLSGRHGAGLVALVDDADAELVAGYSWHWTGGYVQAYVRGSGRAAQRRVALHTLLVGHRGVDHRDADPLNCQRSNLRDATAAQNSHNTGSRQGSSSRFKGVHRSRRRVRPWRAELYAAGARRFVAYFADEEEAARAYDRAALEWHGEFARLNFPDAPDPGRAAGGAGEASASTWGPP